MNAHVAVNPATSEAYRAMLGVEKSLTKSSIEKPLREL